MLSENVALGNITLPVLYNNLPKEIRDKIQLYTVGDQVVFPLLPPGYNYKSNPEQLGLTDESIYYLISYPEEKNEFKEGQDVHLIYRYGVKVKYEQFEHQFHTSLAKFLRQLAEGTAQVTDTDGGDLGRGDND